MSKEKMKAVLLVSHGSRSPKTKQEIIRLVKKLKKKSGIGIFEYAFLEIESPSISEGIQNCIAKGAGDVVVLLNFLNSGRHVDNDIPDIIREAKKKHPRVSIRMTAPIGQHARISNLFLDLIK